MQKLNQLKAQVEAKVEASEDADQELAGMNKLLTQMNEAKAKFSKQADKDSIKEIKKLLALGQSSAVGVARQILDKICQFIAMDQNATFDREGAEIFATAESFASAVKKCDPSFHEKPWIRDVAQTVNMDLEGNKGSILAAVTDAGRGNDMAPFFPYFKILYKFCQIGMTLKSKQSLVRKQTAAKKEKDDLQVQLDTAQALFDNLNFHERISAEVARVKSVELSTIIDKQQMINDRVQRLSRYQNVDVFAQEYFQEEFSKRGF